ncbi:MAG: type II secretion system protein [Vulcanimicrobiota bacterium]
MKNFIKKSDSKRTMRGFTLVELLVTIIIIAFMLMIIGSAAADYGRIVRFSSNRDSSVLGINTGLSKVKREIEESIEVTSPVVTATPLASSGDPQFEVIFRKIDPSAESRLPSSPPASPPSSWDSRADDDVVTIKYRVQGGRLLRKVTFHDSIYVETSEAEGITGLSVQDLGNNALRIDISYTDEEIVKNLSTTARIRNGQ